MVYLGEQGIQAGIVGLDLISKWKLNWPHPRLFPQQDFVNRINGKSQYLQRHSSDQIAVSFTEENRSRETLAINGDQCYTHLVLPGAIVGKSASERA